MKVPEHSRAVKVDLNYKWEKSEKRNVLLDRESFKSSILKSLTELQDYESIEQEMILFKLFVSMFLYPDFETMTEYENEYGVFLVEV